MDQNQNPYTQPDFNQANQPPQSNYQNQQTDFQQAQYQQPQQYQQPPQYGQNPFGDVNSFDQSYQAPVYSGGIQAVKKKFNPLVIIIPAVVLIAAAAVILIIVLSGKQSYKQAEKNFFNSFSSAFSSAGNSAEKLKAEPEAVKIEFEAPSGSELGIPSFSAKIDTVPEGDNIYSEISLLMADGFDLNIQGWVDNAAETIHICFPQLSDVYAKIDLGEIMTLTSQAFTTPSITNSKYDVDYDKYYEALDRILSKVSDTYFELVGDPEIESNQSFTVDGKSYTADKCVVKLDAKQLVTLFKAMCEAIIDDSEMLELISEASGKELTKSDIKDVLEEALDSFDDAMDSINSSDFGIEMTVYMKKNTIVGREIKLKVSGMSAFKVCFYDIPTDSGRVVAFTTGSDLLSMLGASSSSVSSNGMDAATALLNMSFVLEDTAKGDVHSGTAAFKAGEYSAVLEYEDLALTDKLCQGSASLRISALPDFKAALELDKNGSDRIIVLNITDVCKVTITEGPSNLRYKELPNIPSDNLIIIDSEFDPDELEGDEAFARFIEDLSRALGLGDVPGSGNYFSF